MDTPEYIPIRFTVRGRDCRLFLRKWKPGTFPLFFQHLPEHEDFLNFLIDRSIEAWSSNHE